jgi:hypothetical protein
MVRTIITLLSFTLIWTSSAWAGCVTNKGTILYTDYLRLVAMGYYSVLARSEPDNLLRKIIRDTTEGVAVPVEQPGTPVKFIDDVDDIIAQVRLNGNDFFVLKKHITCQ